MHFFFKVFNFPKYISMHGSHHKSIIVMSFPIKKGKPSYNPNVQVPQPSQLWSLSVSCSCASIRTRLCSPIPKPSMVQSFQFGSSHANCYKFFLLHRTYHPNNYPTSIQTTIQLYSFLVSLKYPISLNISLVQ